VGLLLARGLLVWGGKIKGYALGNRDLFLKPGLRGDAGEKNDCSLPGLHREPFVKKGTKTSRGLRNCRKR